MKIGKNAAEVLNRRYLNRDENGKPVETIEGLFRRVASAVAQADGAFDPHADYKSVENRFF